MLQALLTSLVLVASAEPPADPPKEKPAEQKQQPYTLSELENAVITITGNTVVTTERVMTPNGPRIRFTFDNFTLEVTRLKVKMIDKDGMKRIVTYEISKDGSKMHLRGEVEKTPNSPPPPK